MNKKMRIKAVLIPLICIVLSSCNKFSLLKDVKVEHNTAGYMLLDKTIWEFISENNFHENDSTNIGLYGKAIAHAGLNELLDTKDANLTVIIPQDEALRMFINGLGYTDVTDVPSIVLRNLLQNTITTTRVKSFDLSIGEIKSYASLSGDTLYLRRTASSFDEYVLTVNASQTSNSPSTAVRTQNLEFKNGVAHVVKNFTHYIAKVDFPDQVDYDEVIMLSDTIPVDKDVFLRSGSFRNMNYGTLPEMETKITNATGANANYARKMLMQYPVRSASFNDRIGSVKLEVYISSIEVNYNPANLNFFECQNLDFSETTVTWENSPDFNSSPIGGINALGEKDTWQSIDLTPNYLSLLTANKQFINIGSSTVDDNLIKIRAKEYASGAFESRIILYSPVQAMVSPKVIDDMNVSILKGSGILSANELEFEGTADKNISFVLTSLPQKGYLVINSLPASINSSFTQEQLKKGVVKYLCPEDASGSDGFTLEVRDFQGGIYGDEVDMMVHIN